MKKKKTAKELLGEYIDLEIEVDAPDPDLDTLLPQLNSVKGQIKKKVDGIDHFMMELSRREHLIDAEIEALKTEETRLKVKDQQPHLVKIKSMKKEKPTISKVKYEETPF